MTPRVTCASAPLERQAAARGARQPRSRSSPLCMDRVRVRVRARIGVRVEVGVRVRVRVRVRFH